jgi:hypothetical protein
MSLTYLQEGIDMKTLNYKVELIQLENTITERTHKENPEAVQLLAANLNTLYGMIHSREGLQPDVFPITSPERAVRFMVSVYSLAAFQFSSSIVDNLLTGRYSEAAALIRSLVELVAFCEYFMLSPKVAYSVVREISALPTRTVVFRKLVKEGRWPVGGPKKAFERYNQSAHAHIAFVLQHNAVAEDGPPSVSRIWLRRFNQGSFHRLASDTLLPLLGIQEIFRLVFYDHSSKFHSEQWAPYWRVGHDRSVIARVFPSMLIGPIEHIADDTAKQFTVADS